MTQKSAAFACFDILFFSFWPCFVLRFAPGLFWRGLIVQYGTKWIQTHPSAKLVELRGAFVGEQERTLPFRSPHSRPIFISQHRIGGKVQGFFFHTVSTVLATIPGVTFYYLWRCVPLSILRSMAYHTSIEASEQVIRGGPQRPRLWLSAIHTHPPLLGTEASRRTRSAEVRGERRMATKGLAPSFARQGRRRRREGTNGRPVPAQGQTSSKRVTR